MSASNTKSVCVVGAGPAGLVAAKTLLQNGKYDVIIFEAAERVGGMWRGRPGENGDKCSPEMRTNLSRFTVAFSDLAWSTIDLSNPATGAPSTTKPPVFPKAWQVGRYLESYAQKFGVDTRIQYNTRITNAKPLDDFKKWEVSSFNSTTRKSSSHMFDYLVIASGFFGQPLTTFNPSPAVHSTGYMHSSEFRSISSLTKTPGKLVVIGGGISGSEAASQAAFQISNAKCSSGKTKDVHSDSKIYHIVNRPFYCLPRFLPRKVYQSNNSDINPAPVFLPLDLVMYDLSRRGTGHISASITTVPPDKSKQGHKFMRSVIGGDQSDIGSPELVYLPDQTQYPGYIGITDTYTEFVRSGLIVPVRGWLEDVKASSSNSGFSITIQPKEPWAHPGTLHGVTIDDVIGIIEATGYKSSLDFLDDSAKSLLDHDPTCPRIPLLLSRGSVFSKNIPTLAFVGFYEGPYWGVMEMQARLIADTWSKYSTPGRGEYFYQHSEAEKIRAAIKNKSLQVPQFWMMDYVGLIEEFAGLVGIERDSSLGDRIGPAFPSRYASSSTEEGDAVRVVQEVADIMRAPLSDTVFVAPAIFRGLQGLWHINRRIASRNSTPGGNFQGTAHFRPRLPTDSAYAAEYLYVEEGTFAMETGQSFSASRCYIYRYNETSDKITSWFAEEDGESTGALFSTWDIYHPSTENLEGGWRARGHHWCDPDQYKNDCEFRFRGAALETFRITFEVSGPNKDYSHVSWFKRPVTEHN